MKLIVNKKESSVLNKFLDREWEITNIKRFGKDEWVEKEGNIIAEDNGEIVGYLKYHYRGGVMEIVAIIVAHRKQQQGVGTALMKKAENMALAEGAHKLYLITSYGERAIKFYKSLGFKKTGIVKNHYRRVDMTELSKIIR
jgi:ribosomal protein S18 acetylase RimI-like enzyme